MKSILFVCLGNICRSPMAEFVMKKLVKDANLEKEFYIESAATSNEEEGNGVYPPVKKLLNQHGIDCSQKTSRQITLSDYDKFDLIIAMDSQNIGNLNRLFDDKENKIHLLMDYTNHKGNVADPWYTRDFNKTWVDVNEGCNALLTFLTKNN